MPVNAEISAKASLEVKAEIPSNSVGRLIDSLTDVIRPFTEKQGLRADQIRLQREDVSIEIVKKAHIRAEIENLSIKPIPNKLLIPFLEKASLDDLDKGIHEHWAALLLSAATQYQAQYLGYVDIMSRLSSQELKLLEDICVQDSYPEPSYPNRYAEDNHQTVHASADLLKYDGDDFGKGAYESHQKFISSTKIKYGGVMHTGVHTKMGTYYFYTEYGSPPKPHFTSLEILEREGIVGFHTVRPHIVSTEIQYFDVTSQGLKFVRECSMRARELRNQAEGENLK